MLVVKCQEKGLGYCASLEKKTRKRERKIFIFIISRTRSKRVEGNERIKTHLEFLMDFLAPSIPGRGPTERSLFFLSSTVTWVGWTENVRGGWALLLSLGSFEAVLVGAVDAAADAVGLGAVEDLSTACNSEFGWGWTSFVMPSIAGLLVAFLGTKTWQSMSCMTNSTLCLTDRT